jgi:hypothetical protein
LLGSRSALLGALCALLLAASPSPAPAQPAACTAPANCQAFDPARIARTDANAAGGYVSDLHTSDGTTVSPQIVADNFTAATAGGITSLCFWGRYDTPGGVEQAAGAETFRITYYKDASGVPDVSTTGTLASFRVGGAGATAGTSLSRVAQLSTVPSTGALGPGREWSVTHPAVMVSQGQKLWVEVVGTSSALDGSNRWRWLFSNTLSAAPNGDQQVLVTTGDPPMYTVADAFGNDSAFCVNVGLGPADTRALAGNARCETASPLVLPAPVPMTTVGFTWDGTNQRGGLAAAPFCKSVVYDGRGVWYSFVGTGRKLLFTTCNPGTTFDTAIMLYCGSCAGGNFSTLNCVAANDSADPQGCGPGGMADGSSLQVETAVGVPYVLAVFGVAGSEGNFQMSIWDFGASGAGALAARCVSDRVPVDISAIPPAQREPEPCGGVSDALSNQTCASPGTVTAQQGLWYSGTVDGPDRDVWNVQDPGPGAWVRLDVQTEFPAQFSLQSGACDATTGGGPALALLPTNAFAIAYGSVQTFYAQADPSGKVRMAIAPAGNAGVGVYCGQSNGYKFRFGLEQTGACCVAGGACAIQPAALCPSGAQYLAGGTCGPDGITCVPPPPPPTGTVVCCRGSTCAVMATSACTLAPGVQAGMTAVAAASCTPASGGPAVCCKADYNKRNGVELTDVFAFLNDWFGGVAYADADGNGSVDMLDIFSFVNGWFAGSCQ